MPLLGGKKTKKVKEKKVKNKKGKEPEAVQESEAGQEENDGADAARKSFGKDKKLIIIAAAAVFLIGAVGGGAFYWFKIRPAQQTAAEAEPEPEPYKPPEYDTYVVDDDSIESITSVVGYRPLSDAQGQNIEFVLPEYDEEGNIIPPETEKAKDETEETEAETTADGKPAETKPVEPVVTFVYSDIETASADVKTYVEDLLSKYDFKEEFPYYIDNPAGYISLSKDSENDKYKLQLNIDYTASDYKIILEKIKKPKEEIQRETAESGISRMNAMEILQNTPTSVLGLEGQMTDYSLVGEIGHIFLNGQDCYGIRVYSEMPDHTTRIRGTYYVADDQTTIYKYDVKTDEYTKVQ